MLTGPSSIEAIAAVIDDGENPTREAGVQWNISSADRVCQGMRDVDPWSSLVETWSVMSARVVLDASMTIALDGTRVDADAIAADAAIATSLKAAIEVLCQ